MKGLKRRVVKTVYLGHYCKACELNNPPKLFEGLVKDNGYIEWPVLGGYHISYCFHCGLKLPIKYPIDKEGN